MAARSNVVLANRFTDGVYDEGLRDLMRGLLNVPRQLSPIWLYDERGCRLFERICELPEYYLTRSETAIMRAYAREMAVEIGADVTVVEYGSGSGSKTRLLLEQLVRPAAYVPVDIAASSLARATRIIRRDHPGLKVLPLCADFNRKPQLPVQTPLDTRRVIYFPGSTLGNYEDSEARRLLGSMREQAGREGLALIGFDLRKDPAMLERAYDDASGVTAEFNLNVLRHLNRRLGICFEIGQFRHRAPWVEAQSRIEMHLVSAVDQTIRIGAQIVPLLRGDFVRTECSHKYSMESFAAMASAAGWQLRRSWTDPNGWFAVQLLETA